MAQNKMGHFFTGAIIGVGLGLLIAPKEGSETREKLKKSFNNLLDTIDNINIDKTSDSIVNKIVDLKNKITSINYEEAKEIINDKKEILDNECDNLIKEIKKEKAPKVVENVKKIKRKTNNLANDVIEKIDQKEKDNSKSKNKKKKSKKNNSN